jgi:glycosyltransferase involved in cell wall biosynthesis
LSNKRDDADKMGLAGRARYEAMFTDGKMAAATAKVYRNLFTSS